MHLIPPSLTVFFFPFINEVIKMPVKTNDPSNLISFFQEELKPNDS